MMRSYRYDELIEHVERRKRRILEITHLLHHAETRRRGSRRSVEDSLKLGLLAVDSAKSYLEVVRWGRERILRLRS